MENAGFEAYCVGGYVRDSLLGKTPGDWDITTSAFQKKMREVFSEQRVLETGIRHGTLTVLLEEQSLEVTAYRTESIYSDGRYPDNVYFSRRLTDDLSRRDFTVNAMAYHPQRGLVDCFNGDQDLQNGILRCVGVPIERFREDALRILRGLRFSAQLGFRMEALTSAALYECVDGLMKVSAERKRVELFKLICGTYTPNTVGLR